MFSLFLLKTHGEKWGRIPFHFNVCETVQTLAVKNGASVDFVQSMIEAQRTHFPKLDVDWQRIVDASIGLSNESIGFMSIEMFQLLVETSVSKHSNCMTSGH